MIEGLKLDVNGPELVMHLNDRAGVHEKKAEIYAKQIGAIKQAEDEDEDERDAWANASNDPKADLRRRMRDHQRKAGMFRFMAGHVLVDEIYRLSEQDLTRLELISQYL